MNLVASVLFILDAGARGFHIPLGAIKVAVVGAAIFRCAAIQVAVFCSLKSAVERNFWQGWMRIIVVLCGGVRSSRYHLVILARI